MNVDEYKRKVILLFASGQATKEQWDEMANAVLHISESSDEVPNIDMAVYSTEPEAPGASA